MGKIVLLGVELALKVFNNPGKASELLKEGFKIIVATASKIK